MAIYIVGTVKDTVGVMQGFILIDTTNGNKLKVVKKAQVVSVLHNQGNIIKNARLQGDKVVGTLYPLADLSSIVCSTKGNKLVDNGVLAITGTHSNTDSRQRAYLCIRIASDISKSIIGVYDRDILINPKLKLINKTEQGRILTDISDKPEVMKDALDDLRVKAKQSAEPQKSENVESKPVEPVKSVEYPTSNNKNSLNLGTEQLTAKVRDPYSKISYEEFKTYMDMNNWKFRVSRGDDETLAIIIETAGCTVAHFPEGTTRAVLENDNDMELVVAPYNTEILDVHGEDNKIRKINNVIHHGYCNGGLSTYINLKNTDIDELKLMTLKYLRNAICYCKIGKITLPDELTEINNSFNDIEVGTEIKFGPKLKRIRGSFYRAKFSTPYNMELPASMTFVKASLTQVENLKSFKINGPCKIEILDDAVQECKELEMVDLTGCENLSSLTYSFDGCANLKDVKFANIVGKKNDFCVIGNCFRDACKLTQLELPENTRVIENLFDNVKNNVTIILPSTLNELKIFNRYIGNLRFNYDKIRSAGLPIVLPTSIHLEGVTHAYVGSTYKGGYNNYTLFDRLNANEILPRDTVFERCSLKHVPYYVIDTIDFDNLNILESELFGTASRKQYVNFCGIENIIINKNVEQVEDMALSSCRHLRKLVIHPNVINVSKKIFSFLKAENIIDIYMSSKCEAYRALKSKAEFSIHLIETDEEFESVRSSIVDIVDDEKSAPAQYKMLLDAQDPIHATLLSPEYAGDIEWWFKYSTAIRQCAPQYLNTARPELDRSKFTDTPVDINISQLFRMLVHGTIRYYDELDYVPQSQEGKAVFNGLCNLFTNLIPLNKEIMNPALLKLMDSWLALDVANTCHYGNTDLSADEKIRLQPVKDLTKKYEEIYNDKSTDTEIREKLITNFREVQLPDEILTDALLFESFRPHRQTKSLGEAFWSLRTHSSIALYADNEGNAIILTESKLDNLDPDSLHTNYGKGYLLLYIIENYNIVWAGLPNSDDSDYMSRFTVNFCEITSDIISPYTVLQVGDTISSCGDCRINGKDIKHNFLMEMIKHPELYKTAKNGSKDLIKSHLSVSDSYNSPHIRKLADYFIVIGSKSSKSNTHEALLYDYIAQRFLEVNILKERSGRGTRINIAGAVSLKDVKSMKVNAIYTFDELKNVDSAYFKVFNNVDTEITGKLESLMLLSEGKGLDSILNNPNNYDTKGNVKLMQLADLIYKNNKGEVAYLTTKILDILVEAGLMDKVKVEVSVVMDNYRYSLVNRIPIGNDNFITEYQEHGNRDFTTGNKGEILATKTVILIDKKGKAQKTQKAYVSLLSLSLIVKLLSYIGAVRASNQVKPIGGIEDLRNNPIYTDDRLALLYKPTRLTCEAPTLGDGHSGLYEFGICMDIVNCDCYFVQIVNQNNYVPLFRFNDLRDTLKFLNYTNYLLDSEGRRYVEMIKAYENPDKHELKQALYLARELIIHGYNKKLIVNHGTIRQLGIEPNYVDSNGCLQMAKMHLLHTKLQMRKL